MLNDINIRMPLKSRLGKIYRDNLIIDEFNCCQGAVRVDIASIGHLLEGYEIKSEADSLIRLPFQSMAYNYVFNTMTLVSAKKHLKKALNIVPDWWGIWEVDLKDREVIFNYIREPQKNPNLSSFEIASLLWKSEAKDIIQQQNLDYKKTNVTRYELWSFLADNIQIDSLISLVCKTLRSRGDWRSEKQRLPNDGLSPPASKSRQYQSKLSRSRSPQYICLPY